MFTDSDIPSSRRKLGWYEVDGTIYLNKYHALQNCRQGQWPRWDFHDQAYSKEDWPREPQQDLYELYRQRALQIRSQYDHVLIYYSGGIDSHAVLRVFLDNDIKVDGVIVSGSFSIDGSIQTTCNQEQRQVAQSYLEQLVKAGKLKAPVYYLDTVQFHDRFQDENWVYACGQALTPQVYTYNFYWEDPWIQKFLMSGSTCFVRGVDKPRVILSDGNWYASFLDSYIMSGTPTGYLAKNQDWDIQEYFYWTPDFTTIVNKQAHIIIDWFEKNLSSSECETLTTQDASFNRGIYNDYVDPLVYGAYVDQRPGEKRPYFTLGKPFSSNIWHKDYWFFKSRDVFDQQYQSWIAGLRTLSQKIPDQYFNKAPSIPGFDAAEFLKKNHMGQELLDLNNIIYGTVGCWSKLHFIRPARFHRIQK